MFGATKRWFQRNRRGLAVGAGLLTAGYLAGQYLLSKIAEARERMSSDRIAKENLRRRFEQNQTDCTYTILALLPTAAEDILEALPVEGLTHELQRKRAERLARSGGASGSGSGSGAADTTSSELSSAPPSTAGDEQRSSNLASSDAKTENFLHTSQLGGPVVSPSASGPTSAPAVRDGIHGDGDGDGDGDDAARPKVKRSKAQLWKEVKITSITRSFTLIYTLSLLTIFTRTQLNLLGRRNYLSSVISLATPPANDSTISLEDNDDDLTQTLGNDSETNRRYLAFSWWLLHRGWRDLLDQVREAVTDVFGPLNPREDITLAKLSELTLLIRKRVEGSTEQDRNSKKWLPYLLPPREEEENVLQESGVFGVSEPSTPQTATKLRHLLDETADLIESPSFAHVVTLLNNEGFSTLIEHKCAADTNAFKSPNPVEEVSEIFDPVELAEPPPPPKTKLANVLAVMARQAHVIGNGVNPPNDYLVAMEQGVKELDAFAAVVYSSNFDNELLSNGVGSEERSPPPEPASGVSFVEGNGNGHGGGGGSGSGDGSGEVVANPADLVQSVAGERGEDSALEQAWGKAVEGSSS